ncbi:hypothetical protein [Acidiplasma cupricumulans]|uniref:hypothetical protein n=1 Tax=Acidiplasma cupricumulans TaxID=312540 RepID=UPI000781CC6A|nr:hypothetical protein [Acidiplasma cupricumulans]
MINNKKLNRTSIYLPIEIKLKLMRKAAKLNLPLSQLLIRGAEAYEVTEHDKNDEKENSEVI